MGRLWHGEYSTVASYANYGNYGSGYYSVVTSETVGLGIFPITQRLSLWVSRSEGLYAFSSFEGVVGEITTHGSIGEAGFVNEYISPELPSGSYVFEWELGNSEAVFDNLSPGELLTSEWQVEVEEIGIVSSPENTNTNVTQSIEVLFKANSLPELIDPLTGNAPTLQKQTFEDSDLFLNPRDFGYDFYVDSDGDQYSGFQIKQLSDQSSLYIVSNNINNNSQSIVLNDEFIGIELHNEVPVFVKNEEIVDLIYTPSTNVNGSDSLNFVISDGVSTSVDDYNLNLFVTPVVDKPIVTTSTSPIVDSSNRGESVKFVSDPTTIYFNIEAVGDNSNLDGAVLEILHDGTIIDTKGFDEEFGTNYEYNIATLVERFDVVMSNDEENSTTDYHVAKPVTANILIDVSDEVEGLKLQDTFIHSQNITIILIVIKLRLLTVMKT